MTSQPSPGAMAAAAWKELSGLRYAYEAAILRGEQEEAEAIRRKAHDLLDVNFDMAAATSIFTLRAINKD